MANVDHRRKNNWQHDLRACATGLPRLRRNCGRSPEEVKLIAISKTHPASVIKRLIELGAADIGENRVQEAEEKIAEIGREAGALAPRRAPPGK